MNHSNPLCSLIAAEIHQVEDEEPIIMDDEVKIVRTYRKRAKKNTKGDDMNDSNPQLSLIAEEIHQVEDEAPIILDAELKSVATYRTRAKKNTKVDAQIKQKKQKANRK